MFLYCCINDSVRYETQENRILNICLLMESKINLLEFVHLLYLKLQIHHLF